MERIVSALNELKEISNAYNISAERVSDLLEEIKDAKICTPVIGRFSSGKSALLNTVLGYRKRMLKEDITPETAVPTELMYAENEQAEFIRNDETSEISSVGEYKETEADAGTVKCVRLYLDNIFLKEIPDIMLVDMPGFESGYEIHNKAIDNYLPRSLAYIIAFPADDMIVRSSVGNILKELCIYDMPLCVVITKFDKKNDDFDLTFEKLKESLKRYVGDREITYCRTSSLDGYAGELKQFLITMQEQAQEILAGKYRRLMLPVLENTENYLKTLISSSELSESELAEQQESLHKKFDLIDSRFEKEQVDFQHEISECVSEIKDDLLRTLEAEESTLTTMILNKQSIRDYLNTTVRNSVAASVKKRLLPRVEKYVRRVNSVVNIDAMGDVNISCTFDTSDLQKGLGAKIVSVAAGYLFAGPLVAIVTGIFAIFSSRKKREEAKQRIRMQLRDDVFPQILGDVGDNIEREVTRQAALINTTIGNELKEQKKTLENALADVKDRMQAEKEQKEALACNVQAALERIGEIRDGL